LGGRTTKGPVKAPGRRNSDSGGGWRVKRLENIHQERYSGKETDSSKEALLKRGSR